MLYDGDGESYAFDGKSKVGGSVVLSDGTKLAYTVTGGDVTVDGKALTATATGFSWNGKTLVFNTGFADSWLIADTDTALTITEVGGNFTASVAGKAYVYDPAAKTLTLTEGDEVTVLSLMGDYEMSISRGDDESMSCVRSGAADKWRGEYAAADGSKWKFDGLGSCTFGGGGTATYTPASGAPVKYNYTVNPLGNPYIKAENNLTFIEVADGGYSKGGKKFAVVEVDIYYGRTAFVQGDKKDYFFDGMSTVWVKEEDDKTYTQTAYTYEIVTSVLCELVDGDGVRHNGKMAAVGLLIRLTVTDQTIVTYNDETYSFGIKTVWKVTDGVYTKAYDLEDSDVANAYLLTDAEGNQFTAKIKVTIGDDGDTYTMELTPVENTEEGTDEQA